MPGGQGGPGRPRSPAPTPGRAALTARCRPHLPARPESAGPGRARQATSLPARPDGRTNERTASRGPRGREAAGGRRLGQPPAEEAAAVHTHRHHRGAGPRRPRSPDRTLGAAPRPPLRPPSQAARPPPRSRDLSGEAATATGCGAWPALRRPPARCVGVPGPAASARPPRAARPPAGSFLSPRRSRPQRVTPLGSGRSLPLARRGRGRGRGGASLPLPSNPALGGGQVRARPCASALPRVGEGRGGEGALQTPRRCPAPRFGLWEQGRADPRSPALGGWGVGKGAGEGKCPALAAQRVTSGSGLEPQAPEAAGGTGCFPRQRRAPASDRSLTLASRVRLDCRLGTGRKAWVHPQTATRLCVARAFGSWALDRSPSRLLGSRCPVPSTSRPSGACIRFL